MSIAGENNPFLLARPELISAKKKLSLFSSTYDPLKTNLKGFEVYSLTPTEFKEQLKNCCQIYLTSEELGALVLLFDKEGDGRVNSQAFISEFLRLGNLERKRKVLHQRKVTELIERKKEKFQVEREKSLEKLSVYTIAPSFTQEEAKSALDKLAEIAGNYDPQNSIALTAFLNCGELTALEFKEQLKLSLHLNLTSNEIAALIHYINSEDPNNLQNNQNNFQKSNHKISYNNNNQNNQNNQNLDNSQSINFNSPNTINCSTFLKIFYKMSYNEKQKSFHQNITKINRINKNKLETSKSIEKKFEKLTELQLKPIKKNTKENVMKKLETISHKYNQKNITKEFNSVLKVFQSTRITLKHFNEIMKHYFMINFNGSELTALYEMFGDFDSSSSHLHNSNSNSNSNGNNSNGNNNNNNNNNNNQDKNGNRNRGLSYESSQIFSPTYNNSSIDLTPSDLLFYNQQNFNEEAFEYENDNRNEEDQELGLGERGFETSQINENYIHNYHHHHDNMDEKYISCRLFLTYFYQLTKNDKDNLIQKKNYISNRIQRIKKEYESELEKQLIQRKITKITYPDIPNVNLSAEVNIQPSLSTSQNNDISNGNNVGSKEKLVDNMLFLEDTLENSGISNPMNIKRKKTRKLSVLDSISPNRHVLRLFKNEKSLVNLYPSASEDTKNFIRDIEKQEEEVNQLFRPSSRSARQTTRGSMLKIARPESAPSHLGGGINGGESMYSYNNNNNNNNNNNMNNSSNNKINNNHNNNSINGRSGIPRKGSASKEY